MLGLRFIKFSSQGSTPKAIAGKESVTRFTHKSCIGQRGVAQPIKRAVKIVIISPMFEDSRKCTDFFMFSYISRPDATAFTMVAKLSSASIISPAALATSVPPSPIAQPISAVFKAGASFTPSPVIATISPLAFSSSTILYLCSGFTLAKILHFSTAEENSLLLIASNSAPVAVSVPIPVFSPMALAVKGLSPVIIMVLIPALLHSFTA